MTELLPRWFDACSSGDIAFVRQNKTQLVKSQDSRMPKDARSHIINKFSGLQYAILYNHMPIVKEIVELEWHIMTSQKHVLTQLKKPCEVPADSTVLDLVCILGNVRMF